MLTDNEPPPPVHISDEAVGTSDSEDDCGHELTIDEDDVHPTADVRPTARTTSNDSDGPVLNTDADFSTLAPAVAGPSASTERDEKVFVVDPNASPGTEVAATSVKEVILHSGHVSPPTTPTGAATSGSSRRKKYSPTKRLLVPTAPNSDELVAVEEAALCRTEPSVSSLPLATPPSASRARRRTVPTRTPQASKTASLLSNDSGFLSDESLTSTSLNETLQKLVSSACSSVNGSTAAVRQETPEAADASSTAAAAGAMGMVTPEMLCDLMKNSLPLYQAMLALAQQQQQNGKPSSTDVSASPKPSKGHHPPPSSTRGGVFPATVANATKRSAATARAPSNPQSDVVVNKVVGGRGSAATSSAAASISSAAEALTSLATANSQNARVGDVLARMVNLQKRQSVTPSKPSNGTPLNPLAVPSLNSAAALLKRSQPKPEPLPHESIYANTSKKVRELKSELLAAAAAQAKLEAGEEEQDTEAGQAFDWNGSLNGGPYGDSMLAKKQKKPRVTKAQDTKPLSLSGRSSDRELLELEAFAQHFKQQRIKHGFTQGDVGVALGKRYGTDFSQTTISRFEALNLSFKNMCKLRPLLKEWLEQTEAAIEAGASVSDILDASGPMGVNGSTPGTNGQTDENLNGELVNRTTTPKLVGSSIIPPLKKRRKRTNLDNAQRAALTLYFDENCRPDHNKMVEIAETLDLDPDVVRVWFCNRRQKLRKSADSSDPDGVEMDNINVSPAGMDAFVDTVEPS